MKKWLLILLFNSFCASAFCATGHAIDIKTYQYTFAATDNFTVGFADYPKGQENFYELAFDDNATLPAEIISPHRGLKLSGNNHSDDLFMYAYKKVAGLKPNTAYQVNFSLEFASNAPTGSVGSGGSSGDSVYVKIAAVAQAPQRFVNQSNLYQITLDKGNQGVDGKDMIIIGTIGVDTQDSMYRLKTLPFLPTQEMQTKLAHYAVTTNSNGEAWLVLGTDSGFEGTTTIFYTHLVASFKERLAQ